MLDKGDDKSLINLKKIDFDYFFQYLLNGLQLNRSGKFEGKHFDLCVMEPIRQLDLFD